MPAPDGPVRPAVVSLLADADMTQADTSQWPWRGLVHLGTGEPFTPAECADSAKANMPELRAALQLASATARLLAAKEHDLRRAEALLGPYALPGDVDAWDALDRMPAGPEWQEALSLVERYPAELGDGDDEVLVDLRSPGPGGGGAGAAP